MKHKGLSLDQMKREINNALAFFGPLTLPQLGDKLKLRKLLWVPETMEDALVDMIQTNVIEELRTHQTVYYKLRGIEPKHKVKRFLYDARTASQSHSEA